MATIDSGLVGQEMRLQMECKKALKGKGWFYVGTGGKDITYEDIPETTGFDPGTTNDGVLIRDTSETTTNKTGWKVAKITADNLEGGRVAQATNADQATTVSTNIGNQKITDIFESDGKTAKNAVNSTSPLIQGALPTTGWTTSTNQLWTGSAPTTLSIPAELRDANLPKCHYEVFSKSLSPALWKVKTSKTNGDYITASNVERGSSGSDCYITIYFRDASLEVRIYQNKQLDRYYIECSYMTSPGQIYVEGLQWLGSVVWYSVADAEITSNSDVLIQFSDNSDLIVADKTENGQFTIVRDTVPKVAIPYSYKIKKTNNTGQVTLVNRYNWPIVGEWITVAGTRATLTEAGTYQVIASNMQSIIYWDGSTAAEGAKSTKPTVVGASAYLNINTVYPYIDASGTLSLKVITVSDSMGKWAESTSQQTGFKYRKIH